MKIFLVGFNKCGTSSIHHYFVANGIRSVHWDKGELARRIFRNMTNGNSLLAGYENFDAFTDMEFLDRGGACYLEAYKLFPYLAAEYPDAAFILNTRDREDWIRSRFRQPNYAARARKYYRARSNEQLAEIWRADWDGHHRRVTDFFAPGSFRFAVCRIETDLPHLLNKALPEYKFDTRFFTVRKVSDERPVISKWLRLHTRLLRRGIGTAFGRLPKGEH